jgi:hypothetical protein
MYSSCRLVFRGSSAFEMFIIMCNLLEVSFAASNFYLYCLSNREIRKKVDSITYI